MTGTPPPAARVVSWKAGKEAMDLFIDLYMNAFVSGVSSGAGALGLNDADSDRLAQAYANAARQDPAVMEGIKVAITSALTGSNVLPADLEVKMPADDLPESAKRSGL